MIFPIPADEEWLCDEFKASQMISVYQSDEPDFEEVTRHIKSHPRPANSLLAFQFGCQMETFCVKNPAITPQGVIVSGEQVVSYWVYNISIVPDNDGVALRIMKP